MGITAIEYLKKAGYYPCDDETRSKLEEWMSWYKGYVTDFHKYNVYNGLKQVSVTRRSLGMAKTICEDWANLLLNEKVKIYTGTDFDKVLDDVFEYNNFRVKANQLVELSFALGSGAFVEYLDASENITVDYIRADMIYPLSWENGYINECAFASAKKNGETEQIYLQIHTIGDGGTYCIRNVLIDAESGNEIALEGIEEEINTKSTEPLFQIITPNTVNNIDPDSPMGISIYANAVHQLKSVDTVYDSYINEFDLGRKRVFIDVSLAQVKMQEDGSVRPVFDPKDVVFYALNHVGRDAQSQGITDVSPVIRSAEHETGLKNALDALSFKCGLGNDRYRFESGGVRTATEVITEKSELYQSLKKHEIVLRSALTGLVRTIAFLYGTEVKDVTIDFDDSIIQDKVSERQQDMNDVAIGAMGLLEYRMKWYGESEKEATANLPMSADTVME